MTDTLQTLLERLQNADGPDREIDIALFDVAFGMRLNAELAQTCWETGNMPHYTASLDVSIELVERLLPDYEWHRHYGAVFLSSGGYFEHEKVHHETVPLALLTALVQALIAEQEG